MKLFNTAHLDERVMKTLSPDEASWIYNGLDCCVTAEIYTELMEQIQDEPQNIRDTYEFSLRKLAPFMEMSMRGTLVDRDAKIKAILEFKSQLSNLDRLFQRLCVGVFDTTVNWRSPVQLKNLFYGMLNCKEFKKRNANGVWAPTVNREALESFRPYFHASIFASMILTLRDIGKRISFLETEIDEDNRIRTSYNIAGTNTGRITSRMSEFGTGTNLQNVDRTLRYPFISDKDFYFLNIDLEQADARNVGAICWNLFVEEKGEAYAGAFLDAAESGDLHTAVTRMVWPNLPWTDDPKNWKSVAEAPFYREDSYRQTSKKLGHGTNYLGTPRTMAKHAHMPTHTIEEFQRKYFSAFPVIKDWHERRIEEIKSHGTITTLFGRRRMFFGRGKEATTWRKAIAYEPQSCTGEQIDRGLYQIWSRWGHNTVQLINQVHDSILLQIPDALVNSGLVEDIMETMEVPLTLKKGRRFVVPLDAKGGWNWGDWHEKKNPYGLKGWKGEELRTRPTYSRRKSLRFSSQAAKKKKR